jgi:hypothetical protein
MHGEGDVPVFQHRRSELLCPRAQHHVGICKEPLRIALAVVGCRSSGQRYTGSSRIETCSWLHSNLMLGSRAKVDPRVLIVIDRRAEMHDSFASSGRIRVLVVAGELGHDSMLLGARR